jgi:hypothetical protein
VGQKFLTGYIMGFYTTFSGYIFWALANGEWQGKLGSQSEFFRLFSSIPLIVMFLFGIFGFLINIFGSMPWFYHLSFFVASVVVSQGILPTLRTLDAKSP